MDLGNIAESSMFSLSENLDNEIEIFHLDILNWSRTETMLKLKEELKVP